MTDPTPRGVTIRLDHVTAAGNAVLRIGRMRVELEPAVSSIRVSASGDLQAGGRPDVILVDRAGHEVVITCERVTVHELAD